MQNELHTKGVYDSKSDISTRLFEYLIKYNLFLHKYFDLFAYPISLLETLKSGLQCSFLLRNNLILYYNFDHLLQDSALLLNH